MKSPKRNHKKKMIYLFCSNELINSERKDKANSEDKEGQVVVPSLLLDPRKLKLKKNSRVFSVRSLDTSRLNVPS